MGVDRETFACYGVKIELVGEDTHQDDLHKFLGKKLEFQEWGALSYGGEGGLILCDRKLSFTVSENDEPCAAIDAVDLKTSERFRLTVQSALDKGAPIRVVSEPGWWVGMHIY